MTLRESAQSIDDAGALWAARLDRGLTDQERLALDHWLGADTRRIGALARARAAWVHAERARSLGALPVGSHDASIPQRKFGRRAILVGGGAVAATIVAGLGTVAFLRDPSQHYISGVGETRRIALDDGSAVTLDTVSSVAISSRIATRLVTLETGQAFFEVANGALRPLIAIAGRTAIRAVRTAFLLSVAEDSAVSIIVQAGRVALSANTASTESGRPDRILEAGSRMDISAQGGLTDTRTVVVSTDAIDRTLAWREGKLSFSGETLAEAADQFARYSPVRIIIADRALAREPIAGLFAVNDPRGFARAIAISLGAHTETTGDNIIIFRPAPVGN